MSSAAALPCGAGHSSAAAPLHSHGSPSYPPTHAPRQHLVAAQVVLALGQPEARLGHDGVSVALHGTDAPAGRPQQAPGSGRWAHRASRGGAVRCLDSCSCCHAANGEDSQSQSQATKSASASNSNLQASIQAAANMSCRQLQAVAPAPHRRTHRRGIAGVPSCVSKRSKRISHTTGRSSLHCPTVALPRVSDQSLRHLVFAHPAASASRGGNGL